MTIERVRRYRSARPENALAHQQEGIAQDGERKAPSDVLVLSRPAGRQKRLAKVILSTKLVKHFHLSLKMLFIYRSTSRL